MSASIPNWTDDRLPMPTMFGPTMYAPPWARAEARDAADAAVGASEELHTLPRAPRLNERHRRDKPFEGDLAVARLSERRSLDPVLMPPPPGARGSSVGVLARLAGAIGLAGRPTTPRA